MAWEVNGTPNTLGSSADVITISDLTAKKFNFFMAHIIPTGTTNNEWILNNDSSSVYAGRRESNGGADSTGTEDDFLTGDVGTPTEPLFKINYICSISGEEKLNMDFSVLGVTAGAATAPSRRENVSKYVPAVEADITQFEINNDGAGSLDTGSNLSAFGTD